MSKPLKIRPREHPSDPPPPTAQLDKSKNASCHGTPSATSSHISSKKRGPTIPLSSSTTLSGAATDGGTAKALKGAGAFRLVVPGSRGAGGGGAGGGRDGAVMPKKRAALLYEIAAKVGPCREAPMWTVSAQSQRTVMIPIVKTVGNASGVHS